MINNQILKEDIIRILGDILPLFSDEEVTETANLTEFGLDSLTFLHIVVSLEEELGITFPDEALELKNFITIKKIHNSIDNVVINL